MCAFRWPHSTGTPEFQRHLMSPKVKSNLKHGLLLLCHTCIPVREYHYAPEQACCAHALCDRCLPPPRQGLPGQYRVYGLGLDRDVKRFYPLMPWLLKVLLHNGRRVEEVQCYQYGPRSSITISEAGFPPAKRRARTSRAPRSSGDNGCSVGT